MAILLVQLGTPSLCTRAAVARYLRQFLMDPRVIRAPWPIRYFLVNALIVPRRARSSARAYEKIWTSQGSPLMVASQNLAHAVATSLPETVVRLAMRYQQPSIAKEMKALAGAGEKQLIVLPLFPQACDATTGSIEAEVLLQNKRLGKPFDVTVVAPSQIHDAFVMAQAEVARAPFSSGNPDAVIMSFHGLPAHYPDAVSYEQQCQKTAQQLKLAMGLDEVLVTFQSRLGRTEWIRPYTDEVVLKLAKQGVGKLFVLAPAFVCDGLETLEELAIQLRSDFIAAGGKELMVAPAVDTHPIWVQGLVKAALSVGAMTD